MSENSFKDGRREALHRLLPPPAEFAKNEEDRDNYIKAFSAYLCEKDDAYYYNFSFLVRQNLEFREFIKKADNKRLILERFVKRLKGLSNFSAPAAGKSAAEPFIISINDFWEMEAASMDCRLAEDFVIEGASCGPSGDIFTLRYGKKQASVLSTASDEQLKAIMKDITDGAGG